MTLCHVEVCLLSFPHRVFYENFQSTLHSGCPETTNKLSQTHIQCSLSSIIVHPNRPPYFTPLKFEHHSRIIFSSTNSLSVHAYILGIDSDASALVGDLQHAEICYETSPNSRTAKSFMRLLASSVSRSKHRVTAFSVSAIFP